MDPARARAERSASAEEDASAGGEGDGGPLDGFDAEQIVARRQGRDGWLREARRQLRSRPLGLAHSGPALAAERLRVAARRLEDELAAEHRGNAAYEALREQRRRSTTGGSAGRRSPTTPPEIPPGKVNLTDPDSRRMKAFRHYIQGYNAQAVVNEQQIVLAAEISAETGDFSHLRR